MKIIEVTIGKNASVKVETSGFVGTDCTKATAALEAALGSVEQDEKKAEYFKPAEVKNRAGQR